jgi:hypothetical protein
MRRHSGGSGATSSPACSGTSRWPRPPPPRTWRPRPGWRWFAAWTASGATNRASGPGGSPSPDEKALDWHRRAAHRATEDLLATGPIERAAPDDPAAGALEGLSTRAALALVATLPADQAEAIVLRVVAGLAVHQVASVMGKPPGTIRVLTHRGLRKLAERLGPDRISGMV